MPNVIANSKPKLNLIHGFRGLASLLVVLYHSSYISVRNLQSDFVFGIFNFGHAGVDFFFVLSGFIILFTHHKDIGVKKKFQSFIFKRFTRVYPLYWVLALPLIPGYFLFPSFGSGYETKLDVIVKSLLLFPQNNPAVLNVSWSLCYEIFFYLMFSLAIGLKPRFSRIILFMWILISLLRFFLEDVTHLWSPSNFLIKFIFSHYNIHFSLGCLVAYLYIRLKLIYSELIMFIGVTLFILFGTLENIKMLHTMNLFAYAIPSALIILGAAGLEKNQNFSVPLIFSKLGDASYSIYLAHLSFLSISIRALKAVNITAFLGSFLTIIVIAFCAVVYGYLIHLYVEKPLLKYSREIISLP